MGFTTGFTSGVTLTLGIAYLTALSLQRTREQQAGLLRQQSYLLDSAIQHPAAAAPRSREEVAAAGRANFVQLAKQRWNAEVEGAVRWVQGVEWGRVREMAEDRVGVVWQRAFGSGGMPDGVVGEVVDGVKSEVSRVERQVEDGARGAAGRVSDMARDALERTREGAGEARKVVVDEAAVAKGKVLSAVEEAATMAKEGARDAKAALVGTEEKVAKKAEDVVAPKSDVEKALRQRYEKSSGSERSVKEVLKERYTPVDRRDNTVLRGV